MSVGFVLVGLAFGAIYGFLTFLVVGDDARTRRRIYLFQSLVMAMIVLLFSFVLSRREIVDTAFFSTAWIVGKIVTAELLCKFVK